MLKNVYEVIRMCRRLRSKRFLFIIQTTKMIEKIHLKAV